MGATHRRSEKHGKNQEQVLKEHIMAIHRTRPFYEYPRIKMALRKEGLRINHKRVYRLMKELNIQSVIRKKRRYFGIKPSVVHPNRLNQKFQVLSPNEVFVTDITYVALENQCYTYQWYKICITTNCRLECLIPE